MSATRPDPPARVGDSTEELLRDLLPSFFWLRDAQRGGGTLAALIGALAVEYGRLRAEVAGLYDELFVETCRPELVPYIGEGVGVTGMGPAPGAGLGAADRAWVGRVVAFRRSKGTLATAARAVRAATGWATFAQEGREVVAHTQSIAHANPERGRTADIARGALHDAGAPWSTATRGVSFAGQPVRAGDPTVPDPSEQAGYPAPLAVRLAVCRLQSFPVTRRTPGQVESSAEHRGRAFAFHPAGLDSPLFSLPAEPADPMRPPAASELPLPLTLATLGAALARARSAAEAPVAVWRRERDGRVAPVAPGRIEAGDLRDWRPGHTREHTEAIVDPRLGRLLFLHGAPRDVEVSYAYGAPGELGGGPYGHASSYSPLERRTRVLHVSRTPSATAAADSYSSLEEALRAAERPGAADALVLIGDSATYSAPAGEWWIRLGRGRRLRIASAPEAAPVLDGRLAPHLDPRSRLELSGLTLLGPVVVRGDGQLAVEHSTLAPHEHASIAAPEGAAPAVSLSYVVSGAVDLGRAARLAAESAIVAGHGRRALGTDERPIGELQLSDVTVLGSTAAETVVAEDSIFTRALEAERPRTGLIRRCFVPPGSTHQVLLESVRGDGARIRPRFTSTRWGDPGYGQLDLRCPKEISAGGSRGGEMGAYAWLRQPTRFARLPVVLHEMLPAGVSASVEYLS